MAKMKRNKILIIEDNEDDILLMKMALKNEHPVEMDLDHVLDGESALKYLQKTAQEDLPDIIFLDINLPLLNGIDLLERIKKDSRWKMIPVIIITTSNWERDIERCYKNHANAYVVKPLDYDDFSEIVGKIGDFWFKTVELSRCPI